MFASYSMISLRDFLPAFLMDHLKESSSKELELFIGFFFLIISA